MRREVSKRLSDVGLTTYRLPLGATETERHVPVLLSPNVATKQRVIVVFGERGLEAGIFSYRVIGDEGINTGSAVDFVKSILQGPRSDASGSFHEMPLEGQTPGIVIANPGQLYWHRGGKRAVTWSEWQGLPRQSAVHEAYRVDETKNKIPGNGDYEDHIISVFNDVLEETLAEDAEIDIIALEQTGAAVMQYLANNCERFSTHSGKLLIIEQGPNGGAASLPSVFAILSTRSKTSSTILSLLTTLLTSLANAAGPIWWDTSVSKRRFKVGKT